MSSGLSEEQHRKLFIGGLTPGTDSEMLREFYSTWGELSDYVVMKDKETKKSRCFGFVTFATTEAVDQCMKERPHVIDNKQVEPKRAAPKEHSGDLINQQTVKKLFLGGYRDEVSEDELKEYFGKFGNIESIEIICDEKGGRKRGFVFITFDDYDPVDQAVLQRKHEIKGVTMDAKKALTKEKLNQLKQEQSRQMYHRQMYGGYGRGDFYGGGDGYGHMYGYRNGGGYPPHGGYGDAGYGYHGHHHGPAYGPYGQPLHRDDIYHPGYVPPYNGYEGANAQYGSRPGASNYAGRGTGAYGGNTGYYFKR